jgi:serine/threonine protein kinase/WD40 repeat protein
MSDPSADRDPIEMLAGSFLARFRAGERPSVEEYAAQHPELADQIRELLPALVMLEQDKSAVRSASGPNGDPHATAAGPAPQQLGDYLILREIGRGGMGVVYESVQQSLGRHVALKVLPRQALSGATQVERFRLEARAAARLHHTNIVPVFGVGECEGVHYYAMQFIQGQGLDVVIDALRGLRNTSEPGGAGGTQPPGTAGGEDQPLTAVLTQALLTGRFAAQQPEPQPDPQPQSTAATAESLTSQPSQGPPVPAPPERLSGLPTTDAGRSSELSSAEAGAPYYRSVARVGVQVAEALAHAHGRGVLHRDIKPSNLLLDTKGTVWVTDFGLAKAEGSDGLTRTGDIVGTLRYMAPERFDGWSDPRSDVYSLGATLYELLTLRPPFQEPDRVKLIEQVLHDEPTPPHKLDRRVPRDLETIVLKALAKEPGQRYTTAQQMAEDLGRFLDDRTILARRSNVAERFWRWCKRNPVVAGLNALAATLTIAIAIISTVAAVWLGQSRNELTQQLWESLHAQARAGRFSRQVGQRFESLAALKRAADLGVFPERRRALRDEAIACLALPDLRLERSLGVSDRRDFPDANWLAFDAAFHYFVYSDRDGTITVRRVADSTVIARRPRPGQRPEYVRLRFSPDSRLLVISYRWFGSKRFGPVLAWEVREGAVGQAVTLAEEDADFQDLGPDGHTAVLFRSDDVVAFVELATGRERRHVKMHLESGHLLDGQGRVSPDGCHVAWSGPGRRTVYLFDLETGARIRQFELPGPFNSLTWSGDGRLLVVASDDRQMCVWEAATGRLISVLEGHVGAGIDVAFSHGGDFLVSRSWDGTTRLWDPIRGRELLNAAGFFIALSGDDRRMALKNRVGEVEIRELAPGRECRTLHHGRIGNRSPRLEYGLGEVDLRSDGRVLASAGEGVLLWDLATFVELASLPIGDCPTARFGPDGSSLLTYGAAGLLFWPIRAQTKSGSGGDGLRVGPPRVAKLPKKLTEVVFGSWERSGRLVAVPDQFAWEAVLVDAATLGEIARFGPHHRLRYARLSPDGRWLATSTWSGSNVKVWDVDRRTLAWELPCKHASVGFSPDGRWLVTGLWVEAYYRLWHVGSWQPGITIRSDRACNFAFAPDGRLLAVKRGGLVLLVEPESGREFATLEPPPEAPRDFNWLAFSPDGGRLAVPIENEVRVWDLRLIRAQLAEMGLDWDQPPIPTPDPAADAAAPRLKVRVESAD